MVKLVGAVYLVILGVRMIASTLRTRPEAAAERPASTVPQIESPRLLLHGVLTGVLNPKVALFFLAFLPQFVRPERGGVFVQFAVLGLVLATLGVMGDSIVALIAARTGRRMTAGAWRERVTGSVLVALGVRLALVRH